MLSVPELLFIGAVIVTVLPDASTFTCVGLAVSDVFISELVAIVVTTPLTDLRRISRCRYAVDVLKVAA